jgi:uncharacterized protein (TIGR02001 family)
MAQMSALLAVDSDYRLRGYSLSDGRAAASATLSFDHPDGLYAAGSAVAAIGPNGPDVVAMLANAGYARRLGAGLIFDAGLVRAQYPASYSHTTGTHYTEVFVGLAGRRVAARVAFSPDYFRAGAETLYGEVEAGAGIGRGWRAKAHAGALTHLGATPGFPGTQLDWSLAASRAVGTFEVHAILSGRGDGRDPYAYGDPYSYYREPGRRTALVIGASHAF